MPKNNRFWKWRFVISFNSSLQHFYTDSEKKSLTGSFLFFSFITTTAVQYAKYIMLTTEMYLKYKEEEEISPYKYGEVYSTHMQIVWAAEVCPLQ